jgi:integrase
LININELATYRYLITIAPNDRNTYKLFNFAGLGTQNVTMATTYRNLITHHFKLLEKNCNPASSEQVKRNHMVALRGFMAHVCQLETSPIGLELTDDFAALLKSHLSASKLSVRSQTDRRSLLNGWRESFLSLGTEPILKVGRERRLAADTPTEQNPFEKILWNSLKKSKLSPKTAARLAGVSTSAVGRWSRGALPNARTTESLYKLDSVLDLMPGTLLAGFHDATGKSTDTRVNEYRKRQKENTSKRFRIGVDDVRPGFLTEWKAHLRFKTAPNTGNLIRADSGRWGLHEERHSSIKPSVFTSVGNFVSPSASILWNRTSSFLGYLRLPVAASGFGLSDETAQSLAWFAVPEAIEGYIEFITQRSDGLKHSGQEGFCASVIALLDPERGFITQCPQFSEKIPENIKNGRSWEEMCKFSRETAKSIKRDCHDKSRDPEEPIRALLALEQPLSPIFAAMRKLRKIGDASAADSIQEAVARRNEIALGILISNPLRSKNLITLTFKTDNTGDVFRNENGQWRIRITASRMKNRKRLKKKIYNVPIAAWLFPLIEDYIKKFRPTLATEDKSDYFFLSGNGTRFNSFNKMIFNVTRTLIPGCSGFGPHAIRHLVATDWLTKNPNEFSTVSELLNDTIEVIMANYVHLRKDTAFLQYEEYVQAMLPGGVY